MVENNSTGDDKKGDFWASTLGTITKITALITAITGLILALGQFKSGPDNFPVNPHDNSVNSNNVPANIGRSNDKPNESVKSEDPSTTVESVIKIAGTWHDKNNIGNGSFITQDENSFQFENWGRLPQGIQFKSRGSGTITEQNITISYTSTYENGSISQGNCSGTVSADGTQMTLTCTDNILGTFVSSAVR